MKRILLIGAGRSATVLIDYLLATAASEDWEVTIGDLSEAVAQEKSGNHPRSRPIRFDSADDQLCDREIGRADLVISLLPAHLHIGVARRCVSLSKSIMTASYVSPEMFQLHDEAVGKGLLLLNECGLDPGIDHMSAMEIFRDIAGQGGSLTAFYSYTGGLVAPESDDNPWGYKFSWNPRNVILAGQGTARYIENGHYRYLPYQRLFLQAQPITVPGSGTYDGYANRDSLAYRKLYGLDNLPTLLRGTLRKEGYCRAWHVFVTLGLTDDTYVVEGTSSLTYSRLVESLLPDRREGESLRHAVARCCGFDAADPALDMVEWTGIFSDETIGVDGLTPAQILQRLLEPKWYLKKEDKDLVVMQHRFVYQIGEKRYERISSLVVTGDDSVRTAMAKTVGLPLGIAARLYLNGTLKEKGVCIPLSASFCEPILRELENHGIRFTEQVSETA